jgi:hypothetical protein
MASQQSHSWPSKTGLLVMTAVDNNCNKEQNSNSANRSASLTVDNRQFAPMTGGFALSHIGAMLENATSWEAWGGVTDDELVHGYPPHRDDGEAQMEV